MLAMTKRFVVAENHGKIVPMYESNYVFFVYILFNKRNGTLYVGVTNNIFRRMDEHNSNKSEFTSKYGVHKLGYLESFQYVNNAIVREKQLKAGSRKDKIKLIEEINPDWIDLTDDLVNVTHGMRTFPILQKIS